jgi:excisionase family DNA binding protein
MSTATVLKMPSKQQEPEVEISIPDEILTLEEAASFLKVKKRTIYHLVELRAIPFLKVGRLLRFSRSALLRWMQEEADRQG